MENDRLISAAAVGTGEEQQDRAIRPASLADYKGQPKVRERMEIFIDAARGRHEALDHTLILAPGLGKTTLAHIIAREMGCELKSTSGPVLEKAGDLAAILTNLEEGDVLFVDEIHRLSPVVEEILYPAMEDYQLDIMIGEGRRPAPSSWICHPLPWWVLPLGRACLPRPCVTASALFSGWNSIRWRISPGL